ncbi:EAL domain-containing protein [Synechocystis sp. LKSZ1]|uniref:EAL domain-containing protein n=1 Tax=Synechocystis sp. LKSZ1 TaxID=3144951 RepID=UPI00336BF60F
MLHRLVIDSPSFKQVIRLQNACYSIGRHPSNTIVIPSPQISRKQATLLKKIGAMGETSFHIIDGDLEGNRSRNGLWINGESYLEYELQHGDVIALTEEIKLFYQVLVTLPDEDTSPSQPQRYFLDTEPEGALRLPQEQWEVTFAKVNDLGDLPQETLKKLASIIEYSPYPMVETDYFGEITYANNAALQRFETLYDLKTEHPILKHLLPQATETKDYSIQVREIKIKDKFYEQHIHYLPESQFIRSYIFDITERKVVEQSLNYQAFYDPLTDLPNRFLFKQELGAAIRKREKERDFLAVIFLGFRDFQSLNDTLGHTIADEVLCFVTERLGAYIRVGDLLCRWQGDEFALLLTSCPDRGEVETVVERILGALKRPFLIANNPLYLQGHIGIACYPQDGDNAEALLMNANAALNDVKSLSGRRYAFYEASMTSHQFTRIQLEHALHQALEREEFLLYYQPQINVRTGQVSGVEALLRWQHPEQGLVSPAKFIPVLEESGLIIPLGEWVIRKACQHYLQWQCHLDPNFRISINLSPRQFQEPDLLPMVLRVLEEVNLDPQYLELEVTESVVMHNVAAAKITLDAFRAAGIHLSMDDFGTGYSSLAYLKSFPFNTLKIDQAFVRDLLHTPEDTAIIQAMLTLGQGFQLKIVAEGVESEAQARLLYQLGCEEMQGYWFSHVLSLAEMTDFLQAGPVARYGLGHESSP